MPTIPKTLGRIPYVRPPDDQRPDSTKRGYSYRWKKYRAAYLAQHPLCRNCETCNRTSLATLIDHIIPVSDAGESDPNFWPASNHQPLCFRCHSKKTASDKRRGLTR